jgi:hypothetical protein
MIEIYVCVLDFLLLEILLIFFIGLAIFFLILGDFSIEELDNFVLSLLQLFLPKKRFLRFFSKLIIHLMEILREQVMQDVWIIWVHNALFIF